MPHLHNAHPESRFVILEITHPYAPTLALGGAPVTREHAAEVLPTLRNLAYTGHPVRLAVAELVEVDR